MWAFKCLHSIILIKAGVLTLKCGEWVTRSQLCSLGSEGFFLIIYVPTGIQCHPISALKQVISLSEFKQISSVRSVLRENLNALLNGDMNQLLIYWWNCYLEKMSFLPRIPLDELEIIAFSCWCQNQHKICLHMVSKGLVQQAGTNCFALFSLFSAFLSPFIKEWTWDASQC